MSKYENPSPIEKGSAEEIFSGNDEKEICKALIALAFFEKDWEWVQEKCLGFLENRSPEISGVAATCLGHIARIHGSINKERVLAALHIQLSNSAISGVVQDAIDDINFFT